MSTSKGKERRPPRITYSLKNELYGETITIVSDSMEEAAELREKAIKLAYSKPKALKNEG